MSDLSIFRFKWNMSKLPKDFSIAPTAGYCSPGMDVNFVVSFQPTQHDSLIEGVVSIYNFYPCTLCTQILDLRQESHIFRGIYAKHKSGLLCNTHLSLYFYIVFELSK